MKYFHGSRSKFNEFTIKGDGKHGEGFYFTADLYEATYFAKSLYGNGTDNEPTVYSVTLRVNNPLDTMNPEHCRTVMESIGQGFRVNKNARGAKEHYYYLCRQLKGWGISNPNEAIKSAGFDAIFWADSNHMIVFDADQIVIDEINPVE